MGLDMNLYQRVGKEYDCFSDVNLAYWRKVNAIHNWFVVNCGDSVDDCRPIPVTKDDLQKLLITVVDVLKDPKQAPKLLPTTQGFFFGSQDYDKYYFQDLEFTKIKLNEILGRNNLDDIYYQSSW